MSTPIAPAENPSKVAWNRVAQYYGIAFGLACLLGLALKLAGVNVVTGSQLLVFQFVAAFLYMPLPFVAGFIVERRAGRPHLLGVEWRTIRRNIGRVALISATVAVAIYLTELVIALVLGNVLGIPGVGHFVSTQAELLGAITAAVPTASGQASLAGAPPVAVLYVLAPIVGVLAGFTINGLFAFGEEYGWRGVLMDELKPLGAVRANLLTGLMWGLWHAPIIMVGYNYGAQWGWGILMMCAWVTPFSFILWRAREYSRSVVAPAIIHGAFNGSAGFFLFLIADRSPLMSAPIGLAGVLAISLVAAVMWRVAKPAPSLEPAAKRDEVQPLLAAE
jgi:membrane protease YdiL (CAAX protease family)